MEGTWIEVRVITKSEALEPISGIFYGLDCKGVAIEDPNDILGREQGPLTWDFADINILEHKGKVAVVKGYFSEEDNIDDVIAYVKERVEELKDSGLDVGEGTVEAEKMFEEDWANNWKKYYKPIKIGEKIVMADTTVFDIGTGSGILALVASKLGAKHVVGVDLDPVAVDSAKENISFNNVDNIEVLYGNLLDVVDGKADIVVANIIAEIICILVDDVKKALNKDGIFITSGIIHERRQMVIDKLEQEGFEVMEVNKDGEWNCIVAKLK